jgi:hypothetical protein
MRDISFFGRNGWLDPLFGILLLGLTQGAIADALYRPGDSVEYKVRGSFPAQWAQGRVIREYPGGSQYLIREAPNLYFPEGSEVAYATSELRRPGPMVAPSNVHTAPRPETTTSTPVTLEKATIPMATGLLGKEELLAYARRLMGDQPYDDSSRRDKVLGQIRDTIKARGTDFQYSAIDEFSNRMHAQGTMSSHIGFAINSKIGRASCRERVS